MLFVQLENKLSDFIVPNIALQEIINIIFGSLLIALAAQITIPLEPVPITLQSFAVLFIGMAFKLKTSGKIVIAYLLEGICGLPVFAGASSGLGVFLGPTAGYFLGFIPASMLCGYLLQIGWVKHPATLLLAAILGTITLFLPGYLVLAKFIGFHNAYRFGIAPFYLVESIKLTLLIAVTPYFWTTKNENHHA